MLAYGYHLGSSKVVAGQEINFSGLVGSRVAGEELEIRLSSGKRKLEMGLGLSIAIAHRLATASHPS